MEPCFQTEICLGSYRGNSTVPVLQDLNTALKTFVGGHSPYFELLKSYSHVFIGPKVGTNHEVVPCVVFSLVSVSLVMLPTFVTLGAVPVMLFTWVMAFTWATSFTWVMFFSRVPVTSMAVCSPDISSTVVRISSVTGVVATVPDSGGFAVIAVVSNGTMGIKQKRICRNMHTIPETGIHPLKKKPQTTRLYHIGCLPANTMPSRTRRPMTRIFVGSPIVLLPTFLFNPLLGQESAVHLYNVFHQLIPDWSNGATEVSNGQHCR